MGEENLTRGFWIVSIILLASLITGVYLVYTAPESVTDKPINIEGAEMVNSNYLGDAYVVTLAGENQSIQYQLNENYEKVKYEMEIYYTNNTGLHSEIRTFGGAGSSSIASNFDYKKGTLSNYETKTQVLSSSHAVALVHFKKESNIKDGKVQGLSPQYAVGFILIIGSIMIFLMIFMVRKRII